MRTSVLLVHPQPQRAKYLYTCLSPCAPVQRHLYISRSFCSGLGHGMKPQHLLFNAGKPFRAQRIKPLPWELAHTKLKSNGGFEQHYTKCTSYHCSLFGKHLPHQKRVTSPFSFNRVSTITCIKSKIYQLLMPYFNSSQWCL